MNKFFVLSIASLICVTSLSVRAASVQYTMDLSVAGKFSLYAEETDGDNGGIASYSAVLTGGISNLDHVTPNVATAQEGTNFGSAGFTFLRSADGVNTISGSQDTIAPTPNIIYGFGQQASSFASEGMTPLTPVNDPVAWDAKLLLATGDWSGEQPSVNMTAALTFANLFNDTAGTTTSEATLLDLITIPFGGGGDDHGLAAMYSGGSSDLSAALQGAFESRDGGPISLLAELMVSNTNTGGTLADLGTISALVEFDEDLGATGTATMGVGEGKWDLEISADWSKLDPGQVLSGRVVFTGDADGIDPAMASVPFSITVPEPSTVALSSLALVGLVGLARRRK